MHLTLFLIVPKGWLTHTADSRSPRILPFYELRRKAYITFHKRIVLINIYVHYPWISNMLDLYLAPVRMFCYLAEGRNTWRNSGNLIVGVKREFLLFSKTVQWTPTWTDSLNWIVNPLDLDCLTPVSVTIYHSSLGLFITVHCDCHLVPFYFGILVLLFWAQFQVVCVKICFLAGLGKLGKLSRAFREISKVKCNEVANFQQSKFWSDCCSTLQLCSSHLFLLCDCHTWVARARHKIQNNTQNKENKRGLGDFRIWCCYVISQVSLSGHPIK